jgi:hypothetical protein
LAATTGAQVAEVPIANLQRKNGKSNYGIGRTIRVFLDLMMVKFLLDYSTRPLQFFGLLGMAGSGLGLLIGSFLAFDKFYNHTNLMQMHGPLLLLAAALFVSGIQFISMGLLGEISSRTYYESQNKPSPRGLPAIPSGKITPNQLTTGRNSLPDCRRIQVV